MAYCKQCGAYIPDGQTKCLACGYDEAAQYSQATAKKDQSFYEKEREREEEKRRRQQEQSKKWAEEEYARRQREQQAQNASGDADGSFKERVRAEKARMDADAARRQANYGRNADTARNQTYSDTQYTYAYDYASRKGNKRKSQFWPKCASIFSYLYCGMFFFWPLLMNDEFAKFHGKQGLRLLALTMITFALDFTGIPGAVLSLFEIYCVIKGICNVAKGRMEPLPLIGKIFLK